MTTPSLAAGLLNDLMGLQAHNDNVRPAWPTWAEAFLVEFEAGRLRLSEAESAPDELGQWPLMRWAQAYLYHHDQPEAGASETQALRLFEALIQQTAPLQAWRTSGQPLEHADWIVRQLDEDLQDILGDRQYGDGHVWAGALAAWTTFMERSVSVEFANDMLLTALASGDISSAQAALDMGADPNAERDGVLALGMPASNRENKGLALINLLLAAGAEPNRKSTTGQYPEEAWWRARSRDDAGPSVPAPIARLREVAYPDEPLHRIEHTLAYLSLPEFEDQLKRAGTTSEQPWQGRSWAEWHMISLWQADSQRTSDLERLGRLMQGRNGNWQEKVTWQITALNAQAHGQPENAIDPAVLWAQTWATRPLTGPGLDALAQWLSDQPDLPVRASWAARLMSQMVESPQIALGQEPSGRPRYVAWLERLANPDWSTGQSRTQTPWVADALFSMRRSAIWQQGASLLAQLDPADQGRAARAVFQLMPRMWAEQPNMDHQVWAEDTARLGLSVWLAHAGFHLEHLEDALAQWPKDLQQALAGPWEDAQPWLQAQLRAKDLAQRPAPPRARPRSRA